MIPTVFVYLHKKNSELFKPYEHVRCLNDCRRSERDSKASPAGEMRGEAAKEPEATKLTLSNRRNNDTGKNGKVTETTKATGR
jgi:hypothetical protein